MIMKNSTFHVSIKESLMHFCFRLSVIGVLILFSQIDIYSKELSQKKPPVEFRSIAFREGLSNLQINTIYQDKLGYIWIGTARGLNRYDGSEMKHFFFSASDENSISEDYVNKIVGDANGHLFMLMGGKINHYDIKTERINRWDSKGVRFENLEQWRGKIFSNSSDGRFFTIDETAREITTFTTIPDTLRVINIFNIENEMLLLEVVSPYYQQGLISFDPYTKTLDDYICLPTNASGEYFNIFEIKRVEQMLWIATSRGLHIYDKKNKKFIQHPVLSHLLSTKNIKFIDIRKESEIWIGTYGEGLYIYHQNTREVEHYCLSAGNYNSSSKKEFLTDCLTDCNNNIWIGTFDKGLKVFYDIQRQFNHDEVLNQETKGKFITAVTRTKNGDYFLGTRESGLIRYNPDNLSYKVYSTTNSQIASNFICGLFEDSEGFLWIGQRNSLQTMNLLSEVIVDIKIPTGVNEILSFAESDNRYIFFGTDRSGFIRYDKKNKSTKVFKEMGSNIRQLKSVNDNEIFVCSFSKGMFVFNTRNGIYKRIGNDITMPAWIESNFLTFYLENDSILWLGNLRWGLIKINMRTNQINVFDKSKGLPSNDVVGITEDNNGFLWISTLYGLARFDKKNSFLNFSIKDGLENQQFHQNSVYFDGITLYFGGNYGVTHFNPDQFAQLVKSPPVVILKALQVNYKEIKPGDESNALEQNLAFTSSIVLSHKQRSFNIGFVAIDYAESDKITYKYKLEGFDKEWFNAEASNRAVYSNLLPGKYTFMVKAKNSESDFSEPVTLQIVVKQTLWLSIWAIIFYTFSVVAIFMVIFRLSLKAKLYKKEKEYEQLERIRENEVHAMKLKFFADISHEFRTPLTVISGVTSLISKKINYLDDSRELYLSLKQNVDRLLKLINQLLTFRELENDTLNINVYKSNMSQHVDHICNSFIYYCHLKKINLLKEIFIGKDLVYYDADVFEKILSNLISNAIKFTPAGGIIKVKARPISLNDSISKYKNLTNNSSPLSNDGYIEISVHDTGEGIKKELLSLIFERYQQGSKNNNKDFSGSGIGLDFIKRLAIIHKGDITVQSNPYEGSVFSFILPLSESVYVSENKIENYKREFNYFKTVSFNEQKSDQLQLDNSNYKIAIIEDNIELCQLLVNAFSPRYKIIYAYDGEKGLEIIRKEKPDMVISDVMMPKLDGIRLCQIIKSDKELNHLIVVLLSNQSEINDQIEGLRKGADLYIPKPFDLDFIMASIDRQFENRERLHKLYLSGLMPNLKQSNTNEGVIYFLSNFNATLEKEISDVNLNVDILAEKMKMGRSSFYKTFLKITNMTPNAYIAKYRINKAVELFKKDCYTLSEISDLVGFRSASYFSTTFKKEKGVSPRDFFKNSN
jgi:signal transduction histidine kinase/ligand-binding sensor domain-containing protein/DNA-binding response OmpR family regulator